MIEVMFIFHVTFSKVYLFVEGAELSNSFALGMGTGEICLIPRRSRDVKLYFEW